MAEDPKAAFTEETLTKAVAKEQAAEPGTPALEVERMEGPVDVAELVRQHVADAVKAAIPEIIKGVAAAQAPVDRPIRDAAEPAEEPAARPQGDWEGDKLLIGPAILPDAAAGAAYNAKLEANKADASFRAATLFDNVKLKADGTISGQVGANPGPRHFEVLATSGEQKRWASYRIHAR